MKIIDLNRKRADRDGQWSVPDSLRDLAEQIENGEMEAECCVCVLYGEGHTYVWRNTERHHITFLGLLSQAEGMIRDNLRDLESD